MKYTLLELVQQILVSIDGDEINSINDTTESYSIAKIVRECYYDIVGQLDLPENKDMYQLVATSFTTPTLMTLPSNAIDLEYVKYNGVKLGGTNTLFQDCQYLEWKDFIDRINMVNSTDANTQAYTYNGFTIKVNTNQAPTWFSSPDDHDIIFNSYDNTVDAFLQSSKTQAYGNLAPTFSLLDTFTPTLDHRQFSALLNEAKAQTWQDLKQQSNNRAENKARQNKIDSQKKKRNINYPDRFSYYYDTPSYGRK